MSEAEYRQRSRESMTEHDLQRARDKGMTYNAMYKKQAAEDAASGNMNAAAVKAGRAYELDTPEDVRARVDNQKVGGGRGNVNPAVIQDIADAILRKRK